MTETEVRILSLVYHLYVVLMWLISVGCIIPEQELPCLESFPLFVPGIYLFVWNLTNNWTTSVKYI
jgi:hypothetical protein